MNAMPLASSADLVKVLRQYRLLDPAQLQEVHGVLQIGFPEPPALARELVQRGWLTPYQVNQLEEGHGHELLLGSYVLLEKLGQGGMGAVFKARNWKLGRPAAVKVIRKERLDNPDTVRRFYREIQAAGQLAHPNIVLAYDADEADGAHFFAMEYVEGTDLARLVKQQGPLPVALACECARQAALGLQHAFEKGMVHRDVKPSNLLLTPAGVVKVLDLGLARLRHPGDEGDSAGTLTQEGAFIGTLDYIAPEQALDSHTVDIRADLYSLGCSLYFLLTGRVPFLGTAAEKLLKHQMQEPAPLEELRPDVPPAVAAVVRRLMAKRPADRYQTPAEAAEALAGVPGAAGPAPADPVAFPVAAVAAPGQDTAPPFPGLGTDESGQAAPAPGARRRREKTPLLLLSGAGGLGLLGVLGVLVFWLSPPAGRPTAADRSDGGLAPDGLAPLLARLQDPAADREQLRKDLIDFRVSHRGAPSALRAAELLARLPSPLDQLDPATIPDDAKAAWQAAGFDGNGVVAVLGEHRGRHWGSVKCVACSPRGQVASGGGDGVVCLWDAESGHLLRSYRGLERGVDCLAFSADGARLAAGSQTRGTVVWDMNRGGEPLVLDNGRISSLAFNPDGDTLATVEESGNLTLWELDTPRARLTVRPVKGCSLRPVAFSPDGNSVATAAWDTHQDARLPSLVVLVDAKTGAERRRFERHSGLIESVAFSPDGRRLLIGGRDQTVRVWDVTTGEELHRLNGHGGWVSSVAFSPDGRRALSGSDDKSLRLWDLDTGRLLRTFLGHTSGVSSVAFSPDGRGALSASLDHTVRRWDVETGQEVRPLQEPFGALVSLALTPDCASLVTGGTDGSVRLWHPGGKPPLCLTADEHPPTWNGVAVSGDGEMAAFSIDRAVRLYHLKTGKYQDCTGPGGQVTCVALSPDGRLVVGGDSEPGNDAVSVWSVDGGAPLKRLGTALNGVQGVSFSADGRFLFSVSSNGALREWDTGSGLETRRPLDLGSLLNCVAPSPDGRRALVGRNRSPELAWIDRTQSDLVGLAIPDEHFGPVHGVAYAPDGKVMGSAGADGRVVVYDAGSGQVLDRWQLPGPVHALGFAGDGRHLATANANGTVYILRLAPPP
jgi:WD40 repeat protein/tRNA A-37 threonylcarbamoyl transferase component Bud32